MVKQRLDRTLLEKIAQKLGKERQAINVKVSKRANKLGISSEAALILLAKELGIGTANYQRQLDPAKQAEVRDVLPFIFAQKVKVPKQNDRSTKKGKATVSARSGIISAIEYLIEDEDLKSRCGDALRGKDNFDIAINQATLVLEARIRQKADPANKLRLVGVNLVNYAFNADLSKTRFRISKDIDEQEGFTFIIKGVVRAFRNKTHHHLANFTRQEALRVCAFIGVLLPLVDNSVKVK